LDILIYLTIGLVIGFVLGRKRLPLHPFQNDGEVHLSKEIQRLFCAPDYHLMNHVTLALKTGTTQIDHILISRFGVFVIETKDYSGWIFANAKHAKWTQVLFHVKSQFQNPIFQNFRHVSAVQERLDFLPPNAIKSAVVFVGGAEFKTEVPSGVFDLSGFVDYVREQTTEIMSHNRMQFCIGRLEATRQAITDKTDVEHIENLRRKHRNAA
jgi:hypothetical protein